MEEIKLAHDGQLAIATAYSRKASKWKNGETTWSQFLQRLNKPTETSETVAEYKQMNREQQGAIKDVGGFVAGHLKEGKRTAGNVLARSMLTLDADHLEGGRDYWDEFQLLFDHGMAIYSTHSHTENAPRLRIIIPLSRPISAEEYTPLARRVAETFGIEIFDVTTYQPERLMYWPSHARKGSYIFNHVDAPWLNPDDVLATYEDWRDSSFWPTSSKETEVRKRERKKAGDPVEKPGIIGAFCRTYDIHAAIETFLPGVYEPTRQKDRYTYAGGSTAGGLVIYDDAFAYSHHSTDPIGENLVNAFDLVRIHLFGDKDQEAKPETPINKLPSYMAMKELVKSDKDAFHDLRMQQMSEDFKEEFEDVDAPQEDAKDQTEWVTKLRVTETGKVLNNISNASLILEKFPKLKNLIGYNEFSQNIEKLRQAPWDGTFQRDWTDRDFSEVRTMMDSYFEVTFSTNNLMDAIISESRRHAFHPVKEYIEQESWDGKERIASLMIDYLGVEDSAYSREVTKLFFAAAVARIYKPGCKYDYVIVVDGKQGIGKSTFFRLLAPDYFTDSLEALGNSKDDYIVLSESWIVELGELSSLNRTDIERSKSFLSRTEDQYRRPYERTNTRQKRHVVFAGTTNDPFYLKDATGNRRFLPLSCTDEPAKSVFDGSLEKIIGQVWAEAKHLYETTYKYGNWLDLSAAAKEAAYQKQQEAEAENPLRDDILEYLDIKLPLDWYSRGKFDRRAYIRGIMEHNNPVDDICMNRDRITTKEVMHELLDSQLGGADLRRNSEAKKIALVLSNLEGWEKKSFKYPGDISGRRGYQRKEI